MYERLYFPTADDLFVRGATFTAETKVVLVVEKKCSCVYYFSFENNLGSRDQNWRIF